VAHTRLILSIISHRTLTICHSFVNFFLDCFWIIEHGNITCWQVALAHLLGWIGQGHDSRSLLSDCRLRDSKRMAKVMVKANGDIARQFKMLLLILSDRNEVSLIKQNV